MKTKRLIALALMLISMFAIQPTEAATTAMTFTGQDGITTALSASTGFTETTSYYGGGQKFYLQATFDNNVSQYYVFQLYTVSGDTLAPGVYENTTGTGSPKLYFIMNGANPGTQVGTAEILDIVWNANATIATAAIDASIAYKNNPGSLHYLSLRINSDIPMTPAPNAVPEPTIPLLSLIGLLTLMRRRKQ